MNNGCYRYCDDHTFRLDWLPGEKCYIMFGNEVKEATVITASHTRSSAYGCWQFVSVAIDINGEPVTKEGVLGKSINIFHDADACRTWPEAKR